MISPALDASVAPTIALAIAATRNRSRTTPNSSSATM
jgi:hypothetical protein